MASVSPPPVEGESPATTPSRERLTRSRDDRMIAGVAGGLGRYLGVDPVIVRLGFVLLALVGGGGIIAYLIAWLVVPEEPLPPHAPAAAPAADPSSSRNAGAVLGVALVGVGGFLLLNQLVPGVSWRYFAPALLIVLGVALLLRRKPSS